MIELFKLTGWYLLLLATAMEITWVWFSAVMRWREIHDAGLLDAKHLVVRWAIYLNLAIGLLFDATLNIISSIILLELPRYDLRTGDGSKWYNREILLTDRLIRWHHSTDTGWWTTHVRRGMVWLGQQLLDIVDTDGVHIK
jgi:hypothetical protein